MTRSRYSAPAGTTLHLDDFYAFHDQVYFEYSGPNGYELYRTDGFRVEEINLEGDFPSGPRLAQVVGDHLLFWHNSKESVQEFDIAPGTRDSSNPYELHYWNGALFIMTQSPNAVRSDSIARVDYNLNGVVDAGDGDFTTADLVFAFRDDKYETAVSVAVPKPSLCPHLIALAILAMWHKKFSVTQTLC